MPPVKRITRNSGAPVGEITPEDAAKIRSSAAGKEQAPSSRQQAIFSNWRAAADQLGDPFEVERIPISKLRAMRRDPMLGFGLSFIKTPHVRAKWTINAKDKDGPNAQVAAHVDSALRRVYPSLVLQYMNSLDFGFQAIAKRFEFRVPSGTYINVDPESGEREELPIWSEGSIEPIGWKPFVALPPEFVNPIWDGQGAFNGIDLNPAEGTAPPGIAAVKSNEDNKAFKIDLYHSLWVTNDKDANFGSIFGYPRLGYAYRYWWSYWFRWAIADRAFERKADPSVIVYHPEGNFIDELTGAVMSYSDYALEMGTRMRSGGVIALPSEPFEDANGRGTLRQWSIDFTKDGTNFEPFDKSFDYLDVQKLRSLWIPEQAFLEGKGGTSSRNVAAELGSSFTESQAVLSAQIVETINRFIIPQFIAVNYPEFAANGGTAEFVMQGFSDEDVDFSNQIFQLIGQQEAGAEEILKVVDLNKLLENRGTPIASFAEQERRTAEIAARAAAASAPATPTTPGGLGVVPTATGFSYIADKSETIFLADSATNFLEGLPDTQHYSDKTVKALSRQIWRQFRDLYEDEYKTAIEAIKSEEELVELADSDVKEAAAKLIENWTGSPRWSDVLKKSEENFAKIAKRASVLELKRAKLNETVDQDQIDEWVKSHLVQIAAGVAETTRNEVKEFVAKQLEEGVTDRKEIARLAKENFDTFPNWKADRIVRTEVRDIYNAGTLIAAQSAGASKVQALDGDDADCAERDGTIYSVEDALKEKEHPNGTLAWRIIPATELSIERVEDIGIEGGIGRYDVETQTVFLSETATSEQERSYMRMIGEAIRASV